MAVQLAFLVLVVQLVHAKSSENIVDLTTRNWHQTSDSIWLVKFYAPWCAHCKKLEPVYDELAKHYKQQPDGVRLGRVDGTQHEPLLTKFEIKGFPTMILVDDGKMVAKYGGARTFSNIRQWVDAHAPSTKANRAKVPPSATVRGEREALPRGFARGGAAKGAAAFARRAGVVLREKTLALFNESAGPFAVGFAFLGFGVTASVCFVTMLYFSTRASPR